MKKHLFILLILLYSGDVCISQIQDNTHNLFSENNEISNIVKEIIKENLVNKQFVFLGESFHKSGSDLVYKTKFVKYLVEELGFKNIAFESDFYGLYLDKNPRNIYWTWYGANQCIELFDFIKEKNINIWGIDSQLHSNYSKRNFQFELKEKLNELKIPLTQSFISKTKYLVDYQFNAKKNITNSELNSYLNELDQITQIVNTLGEPFLLQSLKNLKSSVIIYTTEDIKVGMANRDRQMADNLDFLSKQFPNKKFIVWAANAHIAKTDSDYMGEATMGCEFLKANQNNSYHVAFASIKMPYRKLKKIEKQAKKKNCLLYYLPDRNKDYFIDIENAVKINNDLKNQKFLANLWSGPKKHLNTKWLEHFDAIVYIENGELTTFRK